MEPETDLTPDMADPAARIVRGVRRALTDIGYRTLTEFSLKSGRRADIIGLNQRAEILIVEVKSSVADFRADHKWTDYRDFCDWFYFAVDNGFPRDLIPDFCGLFIADGYGAVLIRQPEAQKLAAARRRTLLTGIALAACNRLHQVDDPWLAASRGAAEA